MSVHPALAPPRELRFRRSVSFADGLTELWRSRDLVRTLAERELRARYKQAVLGVGWAVITPFVFMVVFSVFFQRLANVDTGGAPYPLFVYLGLLPWTFFSSSISLGGTSLITNALLLNKVYCPREVFPLSNVLVAGVDTMVAFVPLGVLFVISTFAPKPTVVWVPVLAFVQVSFTLGLTLILSACILYLRDLRHALPIALQLGLWATPVAYGMEAIPERFRLIYSAVNPLAPVIDGYRKTVLYGQPPEWPLLAVGGLTASILLVGGYRLFKRLETGFSDVA